MKWYYGLFILVLVGSFAYGCWTIKRWVHYTWGYKSQVVEEVCSLVKTEALKDPSICL